VDAGFRYDVHVEAVAQVDGVDVVAFEVGVHDCKEDLEEEVDGVEENGEKEEPCDMMLDGLEVWMGGVWIGHTMLLKTSWVMSRVQARCGSLVCVFHSCSGVDTSFSFG
jgi:hypothetical protein